MRILSTKIHGILDYPFGIFLFASPWIFDYEHRMAKHVAVLAGASVIMLSIATNYEMGLLKLLSMRLHLTIDIILGLFIAISPVLFDFNEFVYLPHLLFGLAQIGLALITKKVPHTRNVQASKGG